MKLTKAQKREAYRTYQQGYEIYQKAKEQWKLDQRHYIKHFPEKYIEARKRYWKALERWNARAPDNSTPNHTAAPPSSPLITP